MANYPAVIDTFPGTATQGTSLQADATVDHALQHRLAGSALGSIEKILGTTASNGGLLNAFAAADLPVRHQGGTFQQAMSGTINLAILGTPAITGGTLSGALRILGLGTYQGTAGGTTTVNLATGNRQLVTFPNSAGLVTLAVSNAVTNQPFIVESLQGTAGLGTIAWFAGITWVNNSGTAVVLGTAVNSKTSAGFITTSGTTFDGYAI